MYEDVLSEVIGQNGPEQSYATCTAFLDHEPEERLSTDDLCREKMRQRALVYHQSFHVVNAADRAWVVMGNHLALRPTPEYARVTARDEDSYRWSLNEDDLIDQLDDICGSNRVRLVAGRTKTGSWRAGFSTRDDRRTPRSEGAILEEALWGAVRTFRKNPLSAQAT